jgi:hypothetical protein
MKFSGSLLKLITSVVLKALEIIKIYVFTQKNFLKIPFYSLACSGQNF